MRALAGILLLAGLLPAQNPLPEVLRRLRAGDRAGGTEALAVALSAEPGSEAGRAFRKEAWRVVRQAGESGALLDALDLALRKRPGDFHLLASRSALRRDLKLPAGARADLEAVLAQAPGDAAILGDLAWIEVLDFRHREAASRFGAAGRQDEARYQRRLADGLDAAPLRQAITIGGGLLLLAALATTCLRRGLQDS